MVKKKNLWITLFVMPCMVLFCIVYAVPIVTVLFTSFCDYTITTKPAFSGLKNFQLIFGDKDFLISIKNTLVWVALQSTFHVMLGLLMALVLRRKPKGWKFVRTAYMIPNIIPTAATGVMFTLLLNPSFGILKSMYGAVAISVFHINQHIGHFCYLFFYTPNENDGSQYSHNSNHNGQEYDNFHADYTSLLNR